MAVALQVDFPNYYYNPDTGRFLSEDPIGFDGGSSSFYRYVRNSPVNYTDPTGELGPLTAVFIAAGISGVLGGFANASIASSECKAKAFVEGLVTGAITGAVGVAGGAYGIIAKSLGGTISGVIGGLTGSAIAGVTAVASLISPDCKSPPDKPKPERNKNPISQCLIKQNVRS